MDELLNKGYWEAVGERAIKTFAQALVTTGLTNASGVLDVDWGQSLSIAGLMTLLSVLTSIGSSTIGGNGPSLATETLKKDSE